MKIFNRVFLSLMVFFTLVSISLSATPAVKIYDKNGEPQGLEIVDGKLVTTESTVPAPTAFQTNIIQRDVVTLSGTESSLVIADDVACIVLQKITGTVTMYINSSSNLAEIYQITSSNYSSIVLPITQYDTSLIFVGSGTVEVEQRRKLISIY